MKEYPSLLDRVQSTMIDLLLIIILMILFTNLLDSFENVSDWVRVLLFALIFIVYEPLSTTLGCTLGNYIKGIRVRKYADETKRINIFQSLLRYPTKLMLGSISYFTIHTNREKRAIHDLVAGSVMIKI